MGDGPEMRECMSAPPSSSAVEISLVLSMVDHARISVTPKKGAKRGMRARHLNQRGTTEEHLRLVLRRARQFDEHKQSKK